VDDDACTVVSLLDSNVVNSDIFSVIAGTLRARFDGYQQMFNTISNFKFDERARFRIIKEHGIEMYVRNKCCCFGLSKEERILHVV
jgi:hypothetical protein